MCQIYACHDAWYSQVLRCAHLCVWRWCVLQCEGVATTNYTQKCGKYDADVAVTVCRDPCIDVRECSDRPRWTSMTCRRKASIILPTFLGVVGGCPWRTPYMQYAHIQTYRTKSTQNPTLKCGKYDADFFCSWKLGTCMVCECACTH